MDLNEIKHELKEMIKDRLEIDYESLQLGDDALLFSEDAWGIDSVDVLDLVIGVEQVFDVTIKQGEEVKKHFESINTLAVYIAQLRDQKALV